MTIEKLCPIWRSQDVPRAEAFYHRLGFGTVYKAPDDSYLILKRDAAELHLIQDTTHDPAGSTGASYMRLHDIDALSGEWGSLGLEPDGLPRFAPAEDKPWGMRECSMVDPDGNLIRVGLEIPNWGGA